jgi:nucleoid-associated protein YgaU
VTEPDLCATVLPGGAVPAVVALGPDRRRLPGWMAPAVTWGVPALAVAGLVGVGVAQGWTGGAGPVLPVAAAPVRTPAPVMSGDSPAGAAAAEHLATDPFLAPAALSQSDTVTPSAAASRQLPAVAQPTGGAAPGSSPAAGGWTVLAGQSLWSIARTVDGAAASVGQVQASWQQIYALNAATIGSNPDLLAVGSHLVVPGWHA